MPDWVSIEHRMREVTNMLWNASMAVGVGLIDDQHKELFARIDSFQQAMKAGKGREEVLKVMAFMEDYTVKHFTAEEGLQRKANYPKYPDHKKLHDAFVKDIKTMKADIEKSGVTVATGPMMGATLANWLLSHINVHDKALGQYLQSQGI